MDGESWIRWSDTCRLIPSRFPTVGLFDLVASPDDLDAVFELEGWTNDRLNAELGRLDVLPREQWVTGFPYASVIMAAYCHPHPQGARFSTDRRGAWYCATQFDTAVAEVSFHRWRELQEVGVEESRVELRLYQADFDASFYDIRRDDIQHNAVYASDDYTASQALGAQLLGNGSNGVVYASVRDGQGECLVCFRPALVGNVHVGGHVEMRWEGQPKPAVTWLDS